MLWGEGATPDAVVEVVANGTVVARAGADGGGAWSTFLVRPEPGTHEFAVRQSRVDGSGVSPLSPHVIADVPGEPTRAEGSDEG